MDSFAPVNEEDRDKDLTDDSDNEVLDDEETSPELANVDRYWPPPIDNSLDIVGSISSKTVTALTINNSGTRFAAGGHDQEVNIWDFEALDTSQPAPICNTQPCGQTVIQNLNFNSEDDLILVVPGSCQAKIIAKDGISKNECLKGDPYISDMSKTKGHVQILTDGCWNPRDNYSFITSSKDATIRIWNVNKTNEQQTVIKTRSPVSGQKSIVNSCKFSQNALTIAAGCSDGSVLMWDTRRKFITTSSCIKNAHYKGSEICDLQFSYGLNKLCTRSEDESVKVWDLRQLKCALATADRLATDQYPISCIFSPDDKYILTTTPCTKDESGRLLFLNAENLSTLKTIDTPDTSVIRCVWHPKINHIAYSCTNGSVRVCYDRKRSLDGLKLSYKAAQHGTKRRKYISAARRSPSHIGTKKILTPHALPLFKDDNLKSGKSALLRMRHDPRTSYKPAIPASSAKSQGGNIAPAGSTLSSYIARNIAKPVDADSMNIRDRILRHAKDAEKNPKWFKTDSTEKTAAEYKAKLEEPPDS